MSGVFDNKSNFESLLATQNNNFNNTSPSPNGNTTTNNKNDNNSMNNNNKNTRNNKNNSPTGSDDNDMNMMQSQLSSLMDSFMSAKAPGDSMTTDVIDFSVKTPSPDVKHLNKQYNDNLNLHGGEDNINNNTINLNDNNNNTTNDDDKKNDGNYQQEDGLQNTLRINKPQERPSSINTPNNHMINLNRNNTNTTSPREDYAAFLPPDSPIRSRSNSSEIAMTSKLLAETDALMNDTQALTSSAVSNTLKLDAAMDFFERERLAGRPPSITNTSTTTTTNNNNNENDITSPLPPTLSSPPMMPPPSYNDSISMENSNDNMNNNNNKQNINFLNAAEIDLAERQYRKAQQQQQLRENQKLSPAEMFLQDDENMPLGTSIVVRNADMARTDPYSDFRRLSKEQAEATGLFDSFSSRATKYCRVFEAKLRQDIHFNVVQDIFTSIILSRNLVVVMKEHGNIIAEDHREHRTVAMVVGANAYKCRVMLVTVIFNSPQMGSGNSEKILEDFSNDFFNSMQEQLHEEHVTLSAMMTGLQCQNIGPDPNGIPVLAKLANDYEGQLKEAFRREMRKEIAEFGEPLEQYARETEWATALFIGALETAFQSSGIPMPRPARTRPLSDFPLEPPTEEQRKQQKELEKKRNSFNPNSIINLPYHEQIVILDKRMHVRLAEEMKLDADARCKRKNAHIQSRVQKCDKHRRALVSLLKDSLAALGWAETQVFYDTFNIANESVMMSVSCSLGSRLGRVYVTYNHIAFYSNILMFTKKKVVPLRDVVAVWKFDGMVGGVTILSNTHGEISFTIPMNRDRVFAVLEFLLKMHKTENGSNGNNNNIANVNNNDKVMSTTVNNNNNTMMSNSSTSIGENERMNMNPNLLGMNMLSSSSTSGSGDGSRGSLGSNSMHNSGGSNSTTVVSSGDDGNNTSFLGTTPPPNVINTMSGLGEMEFNINNKSSSLSSSQNNGNNDNNISSVDNEQHAQWL